MVESNPLIDTHETGTKTEFRSRQSCRTSVGTRSVGACSSARPASRWTAPTSAAAQSGQQSNYVSRGAHTDNNKWSLDGVDITDMSATGSSPLYYDFDMLEEMQVTTGGADVAQQTGGVGINCVTKSGTDRFRGSAALLRHRRDIPGRQSPTIDRADGARIRRADPEHQGPRLRGRRSDHEEQGVVLGQLRQRRT